MWPVIPASFTVAAMLVVLALVVFAMRIVQPAWWSSRAARTAVLVAFGGLSSGLLLWGAGRSLGSVRAVCLGAGIAYVGVLVLLPAALVMPGAALLDRVLVGTTHRRPATASALVMPPTGDRAGKNDAALARESSDEATPSTNATGMKVTRRALLRFGSASLPTMAAMGSASGFIQARRDPTMPVVRLRWPGLHPDLDGLQILHLSDLHLGAYLGLEDLERGLEMARAVHRPDLIVLTGDLAENASLIPDALRMIAAAGARHGALASLGNHEYLHDITITRPLYEQSPVPLLCASGHSLRIGRATLFIGGADDPVHMSGDIAGLLSPSIEAAAAAAPDHADFRLLLCHRPEGHGPAAASGFDLTLSGHTHGGQLGMLGRSLLEMIRPGIGWWGAYSKTRPPEIARARERRTTRGPAGPSRLYTTSGFGHWFPFRIGCPTEMPLILLESDGHAPSASDRA